MSSASGLTQAEQRILAAYGAMVNVREGHPDRDDPADGDSWSAARTVRAGFLRDLLVQARKPGAGSCNEVDLDDV